MLYLQMILVILVHALMEAHVLLTCKYQITSQIIFFTVNVLWVSLVYFVQASWVVSEIYYLYSLLGKSGHDFANCLTNEIASYY